MTKPSSKPRQRLHRADLASFYYWINERHGIYERRQSGLPPPWTIDPIFQQYKFTNPFRENDKTTVWLHKNLLQPHKAEPVGHLLFNTVVFRYFGTIEMGKAVGWIKKWDRGALCQLAQARQQAGERVYTGAYMINNISKTGSKVQTLSKLVFDPIWRDRNKLAESIRNTPTLQHTFDLLQKYPGFGGGGFMAYEVVTDLRHLPPLNAAQDINTWANAGPGALRGLYRLYGKHFNRATSIEAMIKLLDHSWSDESQLSPNVPPLELRDIEHSLCEWDKYCRVLYKEGRPRSRYNGLGTINLFNP